jgi:cytochrome c biogenesis protein CcdA
MIRSLILLATVIGITIVFTTLGIFTAFAVDDPYNMEAANRICSISLLIGFGFLGMAALGILAHHIRAEPRQIVKI